VAPLVGLAQTSEVRLALAGFWPVTGEVRGLAQDVQVVGGHAYVATDSGVAIFEVATRRQVGFCPVGDISAIQVVGNYAWVAVNGLVEDEVVGSGVAVVDVSEPTRPIQLQSIWISLDRVTSLQVLDGVAYVASFGYGLDMVSIGTNAGGLALTYAAGYYTGGAANRIQVVRWGGGPLVTNLAFLADGPSGLRILDVTVPTNAFSVNAYGTGGPAMDVQLQTNRIYGTNLIYAAVAEGSSGLEGVNVTVPASLSQLWPYVYGTNASLFAAAVGLTSNHLACVAAHAVGVQLFDVSNPTNISQAAWTNTLLGEYPNGYALKLQVVGNRTYVAAREAGVRVLTNAVPTNAVYDPVPLGSSGYTRSVTVSSNLAYVAEGNGGLRVLDVAHPALPRLVGHYFTNGEAPYFDLLPDATKACAVSNYIYVLDYNFGLIILTNAVTSAPSWTNALGAAFVGRGMDLQVMGDRAFVVDDLGTLTMLDVGNRTAPSVVCSYAVNGPTRALKVANNMAYVCNGAGLQMMDVSGCPIRWRGQFPVDGMAVAVDVVSNLAYVADAFLGLKVVDVKNPAEPVLKGCFSTRGSPAAVTVASNWVYVSSLDGGLDVLQADRLTGLDTNCLKTNAVCGCAQTNEVRVGGVDWAESSVQVVGNLIFLAAGASGVTILSQTNGQTDASALRFEDFSNGTLQTNWIGSDPRFNPEPLVWTSGRVISLGTNYSCVDAACLGLLDINRVVSNQVCFGSLCTNLPGEVYWTNLWNTISNGLQTHDSCVVGLCTNSVATNGVTNVLCTNLACVRWVTTNLVYVSNVVTAVTTTNLWCGPIETNYTFSIGLETGSNDRHSYVLDRMEKLKTNWVSVATNVVSAPFTILQDPAATNQRSFYRVRVAP